MRKNKQILVFALLFSFLCFPVKQAFAAAGMTEVPLTVKQSFVVENPVKEMDFTGNYEFRALDQEAPMPENTKNGIYSFSLNGEQVETTFSLQYLHAGVYHYQLGQTTAEVVAEKGDGKKCGDLEFQNSYQGNPPESSEPSNSSKPNDPGKPVKTGDTTPVMAYVLLAAGALLLIAVLAYFRKRNQKKQ